jgi:tRNA(Ile)-lysidine synthetase-like protein
VNPAVEAAVLRFAELVAEDDAFLTRLTAAEFARLGAREPEGIRFRSDALGRLSASIRRRLYLAAWSELGCDASLLELRHLEAVDALLGPGRSHRRAPVPGPGVFARSYGDLWVLRPGLLPASRFEIRLPGHGRVELPGLGLTAVWSPAAAPAAACVGIPPGRPKGSLVLRTWRPGDRLARSGQSAVKVKDALMEARVPAWRRAAALVVEDEEASFGLLLPDRAWGEAPGEGGCLWLERVSSL